MSWFNWKKQSQSGQTNIFCQPSSVTAVQLASGGDRPVVRLALVEQSTAPSPDKIDQICKAIKLKRGLVRLLLPQSEYQFVQIELPPVPPEEMKTAVRWQIKDMLRYPVDAVTIDLIVAPAESAAANRRPLGYAVAAPNSMVLERMLQFRGYKSRLQVIDVPEMAQRNLADLLEEPERATAVLSINEEGGLLTVSKAGILFFTRNVEVSLAAVCGEVDNRARVFDRLLLELQRSIDVFERQFSFLSLSTLWLAPFPNSDELLTLLIDNLYLPVKAVDLTRLFDCSAAPDLQRAEVQARLFLPLGLALREDAPA